MQGVIVTIALLFSLGLVAQAAADATRLPRMLFLLAVGAAIGPSALGLIDVPLGSTTTNVVLTLGVSMILFHGGLHLSARVLANVAVSLTLLSIVGVAITALVCGAVAARVYGLPLEWGLLLGAILSPTDPAILVPLLERLRLEPKVAHVVIAESALNDPTGATLAIVFAAALVEGGRSLSSSVLDVASQIAVSSGVGIGCGVLLALLLSHSRAGIWRDASPIALVAGVTGAYVSTASAGGSGYLGAFIAGLIVGNMERLRLGMHSHHEQEFHTVVASAGNAFVILIFVVLGSNIPWHTVGSDLLPELAVLGTLLLVARPLAVLACMLPDRRARWNRRELAFLMWTRETGVVPAALAALMLSMGVPHASRIVGTVALAAIVTVSLQSTTKRWLAGRLGLSGCAPALEEGEGLFAVQPS
jgi:potassium/hydrogen antiporter